MLYDNPYDVGMTGLITSSGFTLAMNADTLILLGNPVPCYRAFIRAMPKNHSD